MKDAENMIYRVSDYKIANFPTLNKRKFDNSTIDKT